MIIKTYVAQPTLKKDRKRTLTIEALEVCPEHKSIEAAHTHHIREGERIANALYDTLPGGTVDQVLRRLLERRASLLKVRF